MLLHAINLIKSHRDFITVTMKERDWKYKFLHRGFSPVVKTHYKAQALAVKFLKIN
jgi:hypothetical protein